MPKPTDVRVVSAALYFIPIRTRVPLKFGSETLTSATVARARIEVEGRDGRRAVGWGETPLSVQWTWPSTASYEDRHTALKAFSVDLALGWSTFARQGHPIEIAVEFLATVHYEALGAFNAGRAAAGAEPVPHLAALVCCAPFDTALHDAFGVLHGVDVYDTYSADWMSEDLSAHLDPEPFYDVRTEQTRTFAGLYPADFLKPTSAAPKSLAAWHLVGGLDPLEPSDLKGDEPQDGYPVLLRDWIARDGLTCLKIKLRGNDAEWDYRRVVAIGRIAQETNVPWLTADFNCTVRRPAYVNDILDRLRDEDPRTHGQLLYVEQPFPYDLEANRIDVSSCSARKPLFMDESAHDWGLVKLGKSLGWTGVALKTCKTQTGALLSLCWAKAHGMTLMVQDLTNPMLAQVPHVRLAAHAGTIMGVETNAMQFYPEASSAEAAVHPGLYRRRNGRVDLSTLGGPGFGYRLAEIRRELPSPAAEF
ncbi:MAG TPA: enolase C-terminal domain-like protein [Tepidisphaeraceae bacterium]|nr:enolase C-terminal domain-like protein [Tepidisphaeraceae bacterium]